MSWSDSFYMNALLTVCVSKHSRLDKYNCRKHHFEELKKMRSSSAVLTDFAQYKFAECSLFISLVRHATENLSYRKNSTQCINSEQMYDFTMHVKNVFNSHNYWLPSVGDIVERKMKKKYI